MGAGGSANKYVAQVREANDEEVRNFCDGLSASVRSKVIETLNKTEKSEDTAAGPTTQETREQAKGTRGGKSQTDAEEAEKVSAAKAAADVLVMTSLLASLRTGLPGMAAAGTVPVASRGASGCSLPIKKVHDFGLF